MLTEQIQPFRNGLPFTHVLKGWTIYTPVSLAWKTCNSPFLPIDFALDDLTHNHKG
jgi:hypothetical protein